MFGDGDCLVHRLIRFAWRQRSPKDWMPSFCTVGVVAIADFLAFRLGLALSYKPLGVAVVWPAPSRASGVAKAWLPG
jgi:hypothetical protein